jgi:hypothetical protein
MSRPPEILDKIVDLVLAYKPKPVSKVGKKRKKLAKKLSAAKAQKSRSEKRTPT